jgi:hypothetical protein
MKMTSNGAWALALVLAASGCGGFSHLDFVMESTPPEATLISFERMQLVEGRAVAFVARPMSGDTEMGDDTEVSLASGNPDVAEIGPSLERWTFVLFGTTGGETSLTVLIDGELEATIPVSVEVQP